MKKVNDDKFQEKMLNSMPKFTIAILATMLGFAITIRIIGIDISTPINNLISAEVDKKRLLMQIELEKAKLSDPDKFEERLQVVETRVKVIEDMHKKK